MWWAQRRGYVRNTLNDSNAMCGRALRTGVDAGATTRPYYRSTYVFVTRADADLAHLTLDDPRLRSRHIGVQMIGNDAMNTPPAHADREPRNHRQCTGIHGVWRLRQAQPVGGHHRCGRDAQDRRRPGLGSAGRLLCPCSHVPLRIEAVTPAGDPRWPMSFDISMARRDDRDLPDRINAVLERERPAREAVLERYHVPLEPVGGPSAAL